VTDPIPLPSRLAAACLAVLLLAAGCKTSRRPISQEAGEARMAQAEEALARGDLEVGVSELVALRKRTGLAPALRERMEHTLIDTGLQEIEVSRGDARVLRRIYDSDYPERVRVRAGLLAAEALFDEGRPVDAFRMLQKVDRTFPHHPERALAGQILGRVGLHLIDRKGRYSLIFSYRARGVDALEYLILRYPLDSRCGEAYFALSQHYEKVQELDYSLERIEDLLIYHPSSPYAVAAQARLPYLRLLRLERSDYDRGELQVALGEIENWLAQHEDHELASWVRELESAAAIRLADSDLSLARYYERIGSEEGMKLHARRALAIAVRADLEEPSRLARELRGPGAAEAGPAPTDRAARPAAAEKTSPR